MDNHSIRLEFPEMESVIERLIAEKDPFKDLVRTHDSLDRQIRALEERSSPIGDLELETMKKKRLRLKDQVYSMLKAEE